MDDGSWLAAAHFVINIILVVVETILLSIKRRAQDKYEIRPRCSSLDLPGHSILNALSLLPVVA